MVERRARWLEKEIAEENKVQVGEQVDSFASIGELVSPLSSKQLFTNTYSC